MYNPWSIGLLYVCNKPFIHSFIHSGQVYVNFRTVVFQFYLCGHTQRTDRRTDATKNNSKRISVIRHWLENIRSTQSTAGPYSDGMGTSFVIQNHTQCHAVPVSLRAATYGVPMSDFIETVVYE